MESSISIEKFSVSFILPIDGTLSSNHKFESSLDQRVMVMKRLPTIPDLQN